jgi:hypothetical protein
MTITAWPSAYPHSAPYFNSRDQTAALEQSLRMYKHPGIYIQFAIVSPVSVQPMFYSPIIRFSDFRGYTLSCPGLGVISAVYMYLVRSTFMRDSFRASGKVPYTFERKFFRIKVPYHDPNFARVFNALLARVRT